MKKITMLSIALFIFSLAGCGSGGSSTPTPVQPTSAVLKLATTVPAGTSLSGIGVTVNLPTGVTVASDATGAVNDGVVTASVPGIVMLPMYTPATATTHATLKFALGSTAAGGFGSGEFATITCKIADGSSPSTTDFTLQDTELAPVDMSNGLKANGVTATITPTIQ